MIVARNSFDLASAIYRISTEQQTQRLTFQVDPGRMCAWESNRPQAPVPMQTAHGDASALSGLIHSFHQWGRPIFIGVHMAAGLFEFWVERDNED